MDTYKETFDTWNKVALLYQDKFMNLDLYNETYDFFCEAMKDHQAKILEIGCGPGNITKYMLAKRPDLIIRGIDIAPDMIALAKMNNPTAGFEVMDCRQINSLDTQYDGIICGFCIPYLSGAETSAFISDAFNLLAEDGFLYISFVEGDPDKSGFQVGSSGDRTYFYYHHLELLNQQLAENGFVLQKIYNVHYNKADPSAEIHTVLIMNKRSPVQ